MFDILIVFLKEFYEKSLFRKSELTIEKYPACRVKKMDSLISSSVGGIVRHDISFVNSIDRPLKFTCNMLAEDSPEISSIND